MSVEAQAVLDQLHQGGLPEDQASQWRAHLDAVKALLDAPPERALENEQRVAEEFVTLEALHTTIVQSVQEINAQRNRALQDRVAAFAGTIKIGRTHLQDAGVQTEIHYPLCDHRQPCHGGAFDAVQLPATEADALNRPAADLGHANARFLLGFHPCDAHCERSILD